MAEGRRRGPRGRCVCAAPALVACRQSARLPVQWAHYQLSSWACLLTCSRCWRPSSSLSNGRRFWRRRLPLPRSRRALATPRHGAGRSATRPSPHRCIGRVTGTWVSHGWCTSLSTERSSFRLPASFRGSAAPKLGYLGTSKRELCLT